MAIATTIVKAYCGTGFDINNIPASPSLLETTASKIVTLEPLNCLPLSGKDSGSITVRAFQDLDEVDYLRLQFDLDDTVYYCTDIRYEYISLDTVVISFVIDAWLTSGGVANMSSVSGITSRRHVAKADDVLFAFTEEDEMIAPSKPLEIVGGTIHYNKQTDTRMLSVVQSNVDLVEFGKGVGYVKTGEGLPKTLSMYAPSKNGEGISVPTIPSLPVSGSLAVVPLPTAVSQSVINLPYVVSYSLDSEAEINTGTPNEPFESSVKDLVRAGISGLQSLGIESAVTDSYEIPSEYCAIDDIDLNYGPTGAVGSITLKGVYKDDEHAVSAVGPYSGLNIRNKKLYSGSCNKYMLHSLATGNAASFNPEDIMEENDSAPFIFMFTDPRANGKPYFRFKKYLKSTATWFTNLVEGMEWQKSPLVFNSKSGAYANQLSLINSRDYQVRSRNMAVAQTSAQGKYNANNALASNAAGVIADGVSSFLKADITGIPRAASGALSAGFEYVNARGNINFANERTQGEYLSNRAREYQQFAIDNRIVAPQVSFPYNPSLRDAIGNGCYSYKYRLADSDVVKCDQLLTMYGYRTTGPLLKEHFTNRPKFNYIEAGAVKVEYNVKPNKRIRELAQAQIEAGIRIWHVKPVDLSTVVNE